MGSLRPPSNPPARSSSGDLREALSDLPLFPLPNAVLFPGGLLPLHVFEPRYVAMTRHCLETHKAMAIALLDDSGASENGLPRIADVAGAGTIVDFAELPDGRFNIVIRGEARVKLAELPFIPPFRRASAELLDDQGLPPEAQDVTALLAVATAFATDVRSQNPTFDFQLPPTLPPEKTADLVAHYLVVNAAVRQAILGTQDLRERTQKTIEALATQRALMRPPPESKAVN
jgi:Lon protease-like protein